MSYLTLISSTYIQTLSSPHFPPCKITYTYSTLPPPLLSTGHANTNTGLCPWSGCYKLAELLPGIMDKVMGSEGTIIELGSGVGITGVVASEYCRLRSGDYKVTLTDGMDDVLNLLRRNVAKYGNAEVVKNMWMEGERNGEVYDIVFGADLVYERRGREMVTCLAGEVKRILSVTSGPFDEVGYDGDGYVKGAMGSKGSDVECEDDVNTTAYDYIYEPDEGHKPFVLFITRRSYPLELCLGTRL